MAANLPASLKSADITRFAHRAAQLEKAKPVVSYWCNYWIVNQILAKGLHNADDESLKYTTNLMDRLEATKSENASNDAITDDVAGKAYVEQFALETFDRADNAIKANKASRQTADTFQAAATFLDTLTVWGPLDAEIAAKAKYAKFHALRIVKAIKAGEDPNLSNPKPEVDPEENLPPLDPNDAEVQALMGGGTKSRQPSVIEAPDEADRLQASLARTSSLDQSLHPSRDPSAVRQQRQPSIAEVTDEAHALQSRLAKQSSNDESLHPSRAPSLPRSANEAVSPVTQDATSFYTNNTQTDISPMDPPSERKPSIGGNYFPVTPSGPADPIAPTLPEPPTTFAPPLDLNPNPEGHFIPPAPPGTQPQIPPNLAPNPNVRQPPPQAPPPQLRQQQPPPPPQQFIQPSAPSFAAVQSYPNTSTNVPPPYNQTINYTTDEEAIMKAQKHARWAISALNFEDVPTAVRELEGALRMLGAR